MAENFSHEDFAGPEINNNRIADGFEAGGWNQFHFNTFELNQLKSIQLNEKYVTSHKHAITCYKNVLKW